MSRNTLTAKQNELVAKWNAIYQGSAHALNWLDDVRSTAPRVDAEADSLNIKLYQARNLAQSLKHVASTPMTVGFFGLSQAGKSYLISALAADQAGQLETNAGHGTQLNFIEHFNPVGSGKEATGLVTRFTCQQQPAVDDNYPLQLRLFREIEIAMILANAWFKEFDQERVDYRITDEVIQQALAPYDNLDTSTPVPGVSAEDIVAFLDYMHATSKNTASKLEAHYWPRLIKIAPYLSIAQRADVFAVLWGQQPLLKQAYIQLSTALHQLGLARTVYAPTSVLVQQVGEHLKQTNSIMNVDTLSLLLSPRDIPVQVRPEINGQSGSPATILTAQLTALTSEMVFPLASAPEDDIVKKVDLLDFPGYRTREQLVNIEDAVEADSDSSPVARLLLRGKVAYLFERYTTSQEMSALVMCTSSFKQSEVVTVGPVLTDWIENTQGATPEERQGRCGLIWALTMMDGFIDNGLNLSAANIPEHCENMMKLTMMERFGNLPWMQEWSARQPFNNTFLVRKPRLKTSFIQLDTQKSEEGFAPQAEGELQVLRSAFIATDAVKRHIAQPAEAWDAMLGLNDGGISLFSSSFNGIANIDFKLARLEEQWQKLNHTLSSTFERWYQKDGDAALAQKRLKAQRILASLGQDRASVGQLLHYLTVPDEVLRNLYLSGIYETQSQAEDTASEAPQINFFGNDSGFDFGGFGSDEPLVPVKQTATYNENSSEFRFAKAAFSAWVSHLRATAERTQLLKSLFRAPEAVADLVDEIVIASYRFNMQEKLTQALLAHNEIGSRREQTVEKQVLTLQVILQDFVAWFGCLHLPLEQRAGRLQNRPGKVFDFYPQNSPADLPNLPEQAPELGLQYQFDWFSAFHDTTEANAGQKDGSDITLEQNNALGAVLDTFKAPAL